MRKRTLWVGLLLLATFMAEGCCCPRPFLLRRWWWSHHCCEPTCATSYFGAPCCDAGPVPVAGPVMIDAHSAPPASLGIPPLAPTAPGVTMPGAQPLTRLTVQR